MKTLVDVEKLLKEESEYLFQMARENSCADFFKILANAINDYSEPARDCVDHPSHYQAGTVEAIDVMMAIFGPEAVKGFCLCNSFKYLWRHDRKGGLQDLEKAQWYLSRYLDLEKPKFITTGKNL